MECLEGSTNATIDGGKAATVCALLHASQASAVLACVLSSAAAGGWIISPLRYRHLGAEPLALGLLATRKLTRARKIAIAAAVAAFVSSLITTLTFLAFEYALPAVVEERASGGWFTDNWDSSGWYMMLTACVLEFMLIIGCLVAWRCTGRPVWRDVPSRPRPLADLDEIPPASAHIPLGVPSHVDPVDASPSTPPEELEATAVE